jgi:hypothetical protein
MDLVDAGPVVGANQGEWVSMVRRYRRLPTRRRLFRGLSALPLPVAFSAFLAPAIDGALPPRMRCAFFVGAEGFDRLVLRQA